MIRERMKELGITQKQLAEYLGISLRSMVNKLQRKTLFKEVELRKLKRKLGLKGKITNESIWT